MLLKVHAVPNAKRNEIIAWEDHPDHGHVLRVRIGAPATEDKANTELVRFIAKELGVPKSQVTLAKGHSSRHKTLELPDGTKLPE